MCAVMVTRLSASDASFYHLENSVDPDVRRLAVDPAQAAQRAELRDPAGDRRAAAAADSAVPAEGARGDARAWLGRCGSTTATSTSPITSAGRRCRLRAATRSCTTWSRGSVRAPLDKSRPLWEMYLVEGLAKNRVAIYTKIASGAGQRHDGARDRARHRRPHPEAAGVRRGHLDSGPRAQRRAAGARRHRGVGRPARRAAGRGPLRGHRGRHQHRRSWSRSGDASPTSPARSRGAPHRAAR